MLHPEKLVYQDEPSYSESENINDLSSIYSPGKHEMDEAKSEELIFMEEARPTKSMPRRKKFSGNYYIEDNSSDESEYYY